MSIDYIDPEHKFRIKIKNCDTQSFKLSFVKLYYPNGILGVEYTLFDDLICGEWRSYYANGQKYEIKNYEDSVLHGPYKSFYSDGTPYVVANYHALWLNDEQGVLKYDGHLHGKYKQYYYDGTIAKEIEYFMGKPKI